MALGMHVKLINPEDTRKLFGYDEVFQNLIREKGIDPQALEITYGGSGSAGFTELGTAMTAEFKGAAREVTTVTPKTRVLTPGGSYFTFYTTDGTTITTRYCWFSKYQVSTVKCLTQALSTTGTYFTIYDSEAAPTGYYVWLDKNGDGITDKPTVATLTEIVCNISAATTADDVGVIVAAAIDAKAGFGASNTAGTVTITHATKGDPSADAADVDTTYVITKVESGGTDPAATGTGAECDIKAATTASDVGTIIAAILNALGNIDVTGTTTILMENTVASAVTKTTDFDTGYTIVRTQISVSDHGGAPVYFVSSSAEDTNAVSNKDMRKIKIIGFTATALKEEELALAGTTRVKALELLWKRIIHHKGSDWGSVGQDANGNISMQNILGTVSYLVITAAGNESEGGVIWVPNNFHAMIAELQLDLNDIAVAATEGVVVKVAKSGFDDTKNNRIYNTDVDHPNIPISATFANPHVKIKWPEKSHLHGSDVAKLTISESLITATCDFVFKAYILIWYKSNT